MTTGETRQGLLSKFDYARKLAAALCYVALVRLDSIYLQPFAEKLGDPLRLGGGRQRFQPVANYLQALKPGGATHFFDVHARFLLAYPQRGLVIVISDFLDDAGCEKPLQYLADFGHEMILIHVWADEDREPPWDGELDLEDAETGTRVQLAFDDSARATYTAAFDEYALSLRNVALRNGGRYVGLSTSIPIEDAIFGPMVRAGAVAVGMNFLNLSYGELLALAGSISAGHRRLVSCSIAPSAGRWSPRSASGPRGSCRRN